MNHVLSLDTSSIRHSIFSFRFKRYFPTSQEPQIKHGWPNQSKH